jgi:hypothetical protein
VMTDAPDHHRLSRSRRIAHSRLLDAAVVPFSRASSASDDAAGTELARLMLEQLTERLQHSRVTDPIEIVQHQCHHTRQPRQASADESDLLGAESGRRCHLVTASCRAELDR